MANRHDESKDFRLVGNKLKVDYSNKTIQAPKSAIIGIRTWSRIDYLTHYCVHHRTRNQHRTQRTRFICSHNATSVC